MRERAIRQGESSSVMPASRRSIGEAAVWNNVIATAR
jgi:hypothetical protein